MKKSEAAKNKQTEKAPENSHIEKLELSEIARKTNEAFIELSFAYDIKEHVTDKTLKDAWQNALEWLERFIAAFEGGGIPPGKKDFFANGLKILYETRSMFDLFGKRGEKARFIESGMFSAFQKNTSEIEKLLKK